MLSSALFLFMALVSRRGSLTFSRKQIVLFKVKPMFSRLLSSISRHAHTNLCLNQLGWDVLMNQA